MARLVIETEYAAGDYESITVSSTAVGFTASKLNPTSGDFKGMNCKEVYCTSETASLRFRMDGINPTATEGHLLPSGSELKIKNPQSIAKFKAIRNTTTDAVLKVTYYY